MRGGCLQLRHIHQGDERVNEGDAEAGPEVLLPGTVFAGPEELIVIEYQEESLPVGPGPAVGELE